jgi:hypothetical protein
MHSLSKNNTSLIDVMVANEADLSVTDKYNASPIMYAAYSEKWGVVLHLIQNFDVTINNVNLLDNWNLLHIIASSSHSEIKEGKNYW